MEVKEQIETLQKNQPNVRRVANLSEIKKVGPPKILFPPVKRKSYTQNVLAALLLLSILGMGLTMFTLYRYNKLNKRLYQISLLNKNKYIEMKGELLRANKVKVNMAKTRNSLLQAYRQRIFRLNERDLQISGLESKENSYRILLKAKSLWLGTIQGNLRVAEAQIEALKVQQELFVNQIKEKGERIRELTTQLLNNIGDQELLVNQNLKLREERDQLAAELAAVKNKSQIYDREREE